MVLRRVAERFDASKRTPRSGWRFHDPKLGLEPPSRYNVASNISSFVKAQDLAGTAGWASTTPRDMMVTAMLPLVGQDPELRTCEMYAHHFDQQEFTGLRHYNQPSGQDYDETGARLPLAGEAD